MALTIGSIDGQCPVQAEGDLNGNPFYFRARGQHWSFTLAKPGIDPVCADSKEEGCLLLTWGWYGEPSCVFDAGYMPEADAKERIEWSCDRYVEGARGTLQWKPDPVTDALRLICGLRHFELSCGRGGDVRSVFPSLYEDLGKHIETLSVDELIRLENERGAHVRKLEAKFAEVQRLIEQLRRAAPPRSD